LIVFCFTYCTLLKTGKRSPLRNGGLDLPNLEKNEGTPGLVKKTTYHTSGKVTSWVGDKIDGHDHSTNLQLTSSTRYTPYCTCIPKFLSGSAQPFKMQRNTEQEYNC